MVIRPARDADVAGLSDLAMRTYVIAFGDSMSAIDLAAHLESHLSVTSFTQHLRRDVIVVAEEGGQLLGYVQFGPPSESASELAEQATRAAPEEMQELRRLYVDTPRQNLGIGTRLMDAALRHPAMQRAAAIVLDVWEHNQAAQRFYRRYEFAVIGSRLFVVASGAPTSRDLVMLRTTAHCVAPRIQPATLAADDD